MTKRLAEDALSSIGAENLAEVITTDGCKYILNDDSCMNLSKSVKMKFRNYLWIGLFIFGFLLLNHFIGRGFVYWSRYGSEYAIAHREFVEMQDQVGLVFLGDSHSQKGAKASDIPGAYTLASSSESYPFTYYLMKYYLEEKDFQPDLAVVEIDPICFMETRMNGVRQRDPAFWDYYMNYLAIDTHTQGFGDMLPTFLKAKFSLLGGWNIVLDQFWPVVEQLPEPLDLGFVALERDMTNHTAERYELAGGQRADKHFSESEYLDETMVTYFLELIDLLQAHDVQVVLVWYPMTKPYYDGMAQYVPGESHIGTVEELLGDRQVDLVLDYHDAYYGHPELFADPDHLNIWGAELFTQDLLGELSEAGLFELE